MKGNKSAKWLVGISGTAFTAFALSQIVTNDPQNNEESKVMNEAIVAKELVNAGNGFNNIEGVTGREQELIQLDWTNYAVADATIASVAKQKSDRKTKRS